ncbi:hypothetical protein GUJ93_ZPchr0010g10610 [Zizania palustris]|uniref:Uncharacterized protein n=1 Tax=Zizania palustris TaxID=103762 RepID=A0A8J5W6B0_ZIZPA|nr:hypothetical protein GUJ93_ZPchr0010g10610 [Zizania palustris]
MVNGCRCMVKRRLGEDWANRRRRHVGGEPWAQTGRGVRSAAGGTPHPVFARGSISMSAEAARGGSEGARVVGMAALALRLVFMHAVVVGLGAWSADAAKAGWAWQCWRAWWCWPCA